MKFSTVPCRCGGYRLSADERIRSNSRLTLLNDAIDPHALEIISNFESKPPHQFVGSIVSPQLCSAIARIGRAIVQQHDSFSSRFDAFKIRLLAHFQSPKRSISPISDPTVADLDIPHDGAKIFL